MANVPITFCLESRMGTLQQARKPKLKTKSLAGPKAVIVGDVFDNGGFVAEGRRSASADFGANCAARSRLACTPAAALPPDPSNSCFPSSSSNSTVQ